MEMNEGLAPEATATPTGAIAQASISTSATIGANTPATDSEQQAQAEIQTLRGDKTFVAKLMSKDAAANARWTQLHETAYPEPSDSAMQATRAMPNAAPPNASELNDSAAFAPPSSPAGYRFDRLPAGVQHDLQQEQAIRAVFHDAGVPQGIAAQVDRMYSQAIQNPPSAMQMDFEAQKTRLQLERAFGDQSSKVIEVAQREFRAMAAKQPRLIEMVEHSGLGNNFYVISSLYRNAQAKGRV